ncbi:MAG: hypothetical protein IJU92_05695 [Spirochaetaceae bacterium]|nr:hypothetical protein [Spirochaetaceae bacterium]
MLRVLVNGEVLDFQIENEKTVGEVLGEVEQFCNQNNHAVFKLLVDDKEVPLESIDDIFALPSDTEMTVGLFTKSADEIRKDIAEYGTEFIAMAKSLADVSIKLQTSDDSFVLELLSNISTSLKAVFSFFSLEPISGIGIQTIVSEVPLLETQQKISAFLKDITTAFEEKDIITVSDISEYELAPLLETFGNALQSICS